MEQLTGTYTFLSDGIVIKAILEQGQLKQAKGEKVLSVEPIEMNMVMIHRTSGTECVELNDRVRWLPEQEVQSNAYSN